MKRFAVLAFAFLAACSGGSSGGPPPVTNTPAPVASPFPAPSLADVQRISTDSFTNGDSEHATEVEPAVASSGSTVVAAFQTGRFYMYGSSDIGIATSLDGGTTWQDAALPGRRITHCLPGHMTA